MGMWGETLYFPFFSKRCFPRGKMQKEEEL
jgi:hypothetical protein